jgi:hypothetical protein
MEGHTKSEQIVERRQNQQILFDLIQQQNAEDRQSYRVCAVEHFKPSAAPGVSRFRLPIGRPGQAPPLP